MTETELRSVFANNLRYYRTIHNPKLTQEQLSECLDKNKNYIGLLEKAKVSLPLDMLARIADILGVEPSVLLENSGCPRNLIHFEKDNLVEELYDKISFQVKKSIKKGLESLEKNL